MKNKDFLEFITLKTETPASLRAATALDIRLSFRKTEIILLFLGYELLGALFSLIVCPQFGLGFVEGHGISHYFRMLGDGACAAFCGTIFLSSGLLVAFIGMKGEELWWIWRRYRISLILLPAFLWSGLMLFNMSFKLENENFSYHLTWIAMATLMEAGLMSLRSFSYVKINKV